MINVIAEKSVDFTSPEVLAGYAATAIVAVVGLLLTIFILKKVLFKPLKKIMDERQREIDEAVEQNNRQSEALAERESKMKRLEDEQQEALDQKRRELETRLAQKEAEILARAEEEAQTKLTEADRQIEHKQKSEEERLYQEAVDLAISAMSQLYDRELSKEEALALERSIGKEGSLEA